MAEKLEGVNPQKESLEDLRYQLKRAEEEHAQLLRAKQNDPKDSKLRVEVDKAYSKWTMIKAKVDQITGGEEE